MKGLEAPGAVRWIARTLEDAGFETWTVGGAVRDALAERPSGDWDIATRARPTDVRRLFPRTVPIRVDHGTVGVLARDGTLYEVTTFRRDVETTGRHAVVSFADTIDDDLSRRDFTINAVAWHPLRAVLHDPFGGAEDLERRVLRTVGRASERFSEDYLRILRALRFAGVFRMTIEGPTWQGLTSAVNRMGVLSAERIREELEKVLGGDVPPSRALALYAASGVLAFLYPELDATVAHRRAGGGGGWFGHALRTVDLLPPSRAELRWVAIMQGIGESEEPSGAGEVGKSIQERALLRTAALLTRLRASNAQIREISEMAQWVSTPPDPGAKEAVLRGWLAGVGRDRLRPLFRIWIAAVRADQATGGPWMDRQLVRQWTRLRSIARSGVPLGLDELALGGRDLIRMGFAPGPHFGAVLEHLLKRVLDDPEQNHPEALAAEAVLWLEGAGIPRRASE